MKKFLAFALALCFICSLFCLNAYAEDDLYWTLDKGELLISGEGEMPDYTTEVAPWRAKEKKVKDIKSVLIDEGVTHVGQQSFQYCSELKEAYISDSVESIGDAAFYKCKKLETVRLPAELEKLGVSAFDHCYALENVIIPRGVEVIENAAFNCCTELEWVYIPASVTEIEHSAFNGCENLDLVLYEGSWSDWDEIEIGAYNKALNGAEFIFNCYVVAE